MQTLKECSPVPGFDVPLNQEIVDQLTNNFEVKTLKATKNIKKLSGMFAKGAVSTGEDVNQEESIHPHSHSSSHSSSMILSNQNGKVNGIKLETVNDMETQPNGEVKSTNEFEFEEMSPQGVIIYGNMNHPIYMTPFGNFKPING